MRVIAFLAVFGIAGSAVAQAPSSAGQTPSASFVELVRRSGFIFQGTVKRIGASTPGVPAQTNTMIVVVDHVIEAYPPVGQNKGYEVTVRVADPKQFFHGKAATFFTSVYSAGTTLGLDAAGTLHPDPPSAVLRQVRDARQILADRALAARLASAQSVVVGVRGAAPAPAPAPIAMKDPAWNLRPIQVQRVEKGGPQGASVSVNVATVDDVAWLAAPRPSVGATGIFLLQPKPARDHWSSVTGVFLVEPLDVLPLSELDRVRRLLRSLP